MTNTRASSHVPSRAPKNASSTRRSSATRKPQKRSGASHRGTPDGPPTLSKGQVVGFFIGLASGIVLGAGFVFYEFGRDTTQTSTTVDTETNVEPTPEADEPTFKFFTLLPNQELNLADDVEPAELRNDPAEAVQYVLQAGSFRLRNDAEQRRAELALLGLEASIEQTNSASGTWFRVYTGPFDSRSKMARARSMTEQQAIDTLLLKRTPN